MLNRVRVVPVMVIWASLIFSGIQLAKGHCDRAVLICLWGNLLLLLHKELKF